MAKLTKTCPTCLHEYPRAEFFHKGGTGSRRSTCGDCNKRYHRAWRQRRREERIARFPSRILRERRRQGAFKLVEMMVRAHGGVEQLATEWHMAFEEARKRRPGSAEVMRNYRAILALGTAVYEATRQHPEPAVSRPSIQQMSDAELEQALDDAIARIVGQCQDDAELEDDLTPAAPEADPAEDAGPS